MQAQSRADAQPVVRAADSEFDRHRPACGHSVARPQNVEFPKHEIGGILALE